MQNIVFLKKFVYSSLIKKRKYICHKGYACIQDLYVNAKEFGLTDEQRDKFFSYVRSHNKEVHSHIRSINKRLSRTESAIYSDFDESELGSYSGRYFIGNERLISEEEESRLLEQLEFLESLIISFKNDVIKKDPISRIPLIDTLKKWKQKEGSLEDYISSDSVYRSDFNTNVLRTLGNEFIYPTSITSSPDDLP